MKKKVKTFKTILYMRVIRELIQLVKETRISSSFSTPRIRTSMITNTKDFRKEIRDIKRRSLKFKTAIIAVFISNFS